VTPDRLREAIRGGYYDPPVTARRASSIPAELRRAAARGAPDARFEPAPADGVLPDGFFSTTNLPTTCTRERLVAQAPPAAHDCVIVLHPKVDLVVTEPRRVKQGQLVAVGTAEDGSQGILVHPKASSAAAQRQRIGFMQTAVSRERR